MAPPRKSKKVLELTGSVRRNPARYKGRGQVPGPDELGQLGDPPPHMSICAQAAWIELAGLAPEGLLARSDRLSLEVLCNLLAEFRNAPSDFSAARMSVLQRLLGKFGMLGPASREGWIPETDPKDDPLAKFFDDF